MTTARRLSAVLIAAGVLLLADAAVTVLWQEPLTAIVTGVRQRGLGDDLEALRRAGPTPLELEALAGLRGDGRRSAFLARSLRRRTEEGDALGRIKVGRIDLDAVVIEGTAPADLREGPGFYDDAPLPGMRGTVAIAGHRTTYGAPFRHLDRLRPGDTVELEMPYARFTYRVQRTRIVPPTQLSVLRRMPYDRLILSACHPLYSAAMRIVVMARLERTVPAGRYATA